MKPLREYLKKHEKTDIIFDFDGTIFELLLPWHLHFQNIREELKALDEEIFSDYERDWTTDVSVQHRYLSKYGERAKEILDKNSQMFERNYLKGVRINHDLVEFIRNDTHYKKYLWSSNSIHTLERVLNEHHLNDAFEKVIGREAVAVIKPRTFGFDHISNGKTHISKFLFVGDSINDKGAARELGMDFFRVQF